MKAQRRIVFGILLAALLALCFGALADSPLGVQTGAHYQSIRLTSSSNAATVLDYLEDYLDTEMAAKMILAEDLADYSGKIEQNRDALSRANNDQLTEWLRVYDSVPVGGTLTARELVVRSQRELTESRNEMNFYAVKLREYITLDEDYRDQISSGYYTPEEIDRLKDELAIVDREAEKYRAAALNKLTGNVELTESVRRADVQLSVFDGSNPYQGSVKAIQGLGAYIEQKQAEALALRENGNDVPTITVISKKQVGICIMDPEHTGTLDTPVGVQGIAVTMQAESSPGVLDPNKKQTVVTNDKGLAIFEIANFNPDNDRNILVHMSFTDAKEREDTSVAYQRKYYGLLHLQGGSNPFSVYADVDNGDPYLVSLLFEDLDMSVSDEGMYITQNDVKQYSVHGEVEMNGHTDINVHVKGTEIAPSAFGNEAGGQVLFDEVVKPGGDGTFSVKSQWLNRGAASDAVAFREGHQFIVEVYGEPRTAQAAVNWNKVYNTSFHLIESDEWVDTFFPQGSPGPSSGTFLDSFVGAIGLKLPGDIPVIGGSEIDIAGIMKYTGFMQKHPKLEKIKIQVNFPNRVLIAFNHVLRNPEKDDQGRLYASKGIKEAEKRQDAEKQDNQNKKSRMEQGLDDEITIRDYGNFATTFSYGLSVYVQGVFTGDITGERFILTGDVTPGVIFDVSLDITSYTPIPLVYVNLNILFRINLGFDLGADITWDESRAWPTGITWSKNAGLTVTLHLELTASLNVGIKGVVSAGIRGAGWIDYSIHINYWDLERTIKIGVRIELYFDTFFYHWSTTFMEWNTSYTTDYPRSAEATPAPAPVTAKRASFTAGSASPHKYGEVYCDPKDMKLIASDRNIFCFWVDRSVTPNTLNIHLVDSLRDADIEDDKKKYPDAVVFTVPNEWKYLYDFDVCYDPDIHSTQYKYDTGTKGFMYVVSMGNWEGGIDLGKEDPSYGDHSLEAGYREFIWEMCTNAGGATYYGSVIIYRDSLHINYCEKLYFEKHANVALFEPQIQQAAFRADETTGRRSRKYTVAIAGIDPYLEGDGTCRYNLMQVMIDTDMRSYSREYPVIQDCILPGEKASEDDRYYLPQYWLLDGVDSFQGYLNEIFYTNTVLILEKNVRGDERFRIFRDGFLNEMYVPDGKHVAQISDPIRVNITYFGEDFGNETRYFFLTSLVEETDPEAEIPTADCKRSVMTVIYHEDIDPEPRARELGTYGFASGRLDQYELPGGGGNAKGMYIPNQDAMYFYWFDYCAAGDDPDTNMVRISACQYDADRKALSPRFTLATMPEEDCMAREFMCMRDKKTGEMKLTGFYYDESGALKKQSIHMETCPSIMAFAPTVLAVGEGHGFDVLARIENTGSIVLQKIGYQLSAEHVETGAQSIWQTGEIDLRIPTQSSVTHYDYLQQDHPELMGRSLKELEAALNALNDPQYVSTGEYTVYRVPDNHDGLNGNIQHVTTHTVEDGKLVTHEDTVEEYFFMPGNIATYRYWIEGAATHDMAGEYTLGMGINFVNFSLGMSDDAPVYQAALREDGKGLEYFLLDENGERVRAANGEEDGVLALFAPDLPGKIVETATVTSKTGLNTARNDALTHGHERYLTMEQNDYGLNARVHSVNGVPYVDFTMSNYAPEIAPNGTPRLIAKAKYLDRETPTGWVAVFPRTNIKDGFNRGITVPLKEIANGAKYEELTVYLVTSASEDPLDFMDMNIYNNKALLTVDTPLRILRQPQNITVEEGKDAVFTVVPEAADRCRYQWAVCLPDDTMMQLPGETGQTLTVKNAQRSQSGYCYCCLVSVPDGRTVRSDWGVLTVTAKVPKTGDAVNPFALAAIGVAAAAACAALAVTLARKRKKV